MKLVLQRVNHAKVEVDNKITGEIEKGYLILFGAGKGDTTADADRLAKKVCNLRIFNDDNDKINLSLKDVGGRILVVSQFTLYADCSHGNRPSFINACPPDEANDLYEYFCEACEGYVGKVEKGIFGAEMKVSLENDGPFTLTLE